jgi:shikimate dehydrogenase
VLGAGGSARAAVWALRGAGASVSVWNRTRARAEELAAELGAAVADPDPVTGILPASRYIVIVNTTTVGMQPPASPGAHLKALHLAADAFTDRQSVVDLVYGHAETELVRTARERGAQAIDGREVLVHQGAASFRIWTGVEPPLEAMRQEAGS